METEFGVLPPRKEFICYLKASTPSSRVWLQGVVVDVKGEKLTLDDGTGTVRVAAEPQEHKNLLVKGIFCVL